MRSWIPAVTPYRDIWIDGATDAYGLVDVLTKWFSILVRRTSGHTTNTCQQTQARRG